MTAAASIPSLEELCAQFRRVVAQLGEVDLTGASKDALVELERTIETGRRQLDAVEFRVVNVIVEWDLAGDHGCASPATFLSQLLTISPAAARARVKDAATFGPRRAMSGEPLQPLFGLCADAVATGAINSQAARAIRDELTKLPDVITHDMGAFLEENLVEYARLVDAVETRRYAQKLRYSLDQDGRLRDEARNDKARCLIRRRNPDGSARYVLDATNELAELLDTVLDATSAPEPAKDGTPDPRTPSQRAHDGLHDALRLLLQTGRLPDTAGCRTTVVLHANVDDYLRGEGDVTTGHGFAVPMSTAKRWLEPDARAVLVLLTRTRAVAAYSHLGRLFTETQRLVMHSRDRGCSFPGCDRPAAWCQAHHVRDYADTGHTTVDEGALACGEHHRSFEKLGWRSVMVNGVPAWVPPKWVDAAQRPRTNSRHQPLEPTLPE